MITGFLGDYGPIWGGDYALYRGDYGDYGDYVITSKDKSCPYFSVEERKRWHEERGIDDPRKKVVEKKRMEDPAPSSPPVSKPAETSVKEEPKKEKKEKKEKEGMTKEERYRIKNREKLAARARERRAGK